MDIQALLKTLVSQDGSDLYLSTGAPPCAKFNGVLRPLSGDSLKPGEIAAIAMAIMDAEQRLEFERDLEMNLALSIHGVGRFRINIFKQRNEVSIVARNIKLDIPRFEDLKLPPILLDVIMRKRGLVLFVGATGSGKSTSLAALIDYRNRSSSGHIITIEDPVEYIHRHKKSIINQREVGVDTRSFQAALKNTLRQAPDVILIGEIRDRETMEHALAFADTGHLAISTLHANNANQALDRIINFFPEDRRPQLLNDLGNNLQAFAGLIDHPRPDPSRRVCRTQGHHGKSRQPGHADFRQCAFRVGGRRGDRRGGSAEERRLAKQPAPAPQAACRWRRPAHQRPSGAHPHGGAAARRLGLGG
jgi:twitching motility protein PilU